MPSPEEALHKIQTFNSQNIANTAWAFATLNHYDRALFNTLAQEAPHKIQTFNSQAIANTAWAFATLNHYDRALFDALAKEALHKIQTFNSQAIANTAWAFATFNHYDRALFNALAQEAPHKIQTFNSQNIANTAWAFACCNQLSENLIQLLVEHLQPEKLKIIGLRQIEYVRLHLVYEMAMGNSPLAHRLLEWTKSLNSQKTSSSKLHLDVARHLTGIMPGVRNEVSINGLMVDMPSQK